MSISISIVKQYKNHLKKGIRIDGFEFVKKFKQFWFQIME